jgi:methyl coenzyme M reductase subunit D
MANYGDGTGSASFAFTIPDTEAIEEVSEAIEEVGEAIEAVSEEIVESVEEVIEAVVPGGLQCGPGTHADDGYCVTDNQSFELETDTSSMSDLILGASIVFGIAVTIIIALRLIGRASRN